MTQDDAESKTTTVPLEPEQETGGLGSLIPIDRPTFLDYSPRALHFGTSGLRGLVRDMTDIEVYINTRGFLDYLQKSGEIGLGDPIAIARDLREIDPSTGLSSSPRITATARQAIRDSGFSVIDCGKVPTPALAYFSQMEDTATNKKPMPGIMVTGSHIPADRNGIKFYKPSGEVLKSDEPGILTAVDAIRTIEYSKAESQSAFDQHGMLRKPPDSGEQNQEAQAVYSDRYLGLFPDKQPLTGMKLVVYQHSAVGRDLMVSILDHLGANVIPVGRSETFIAMDTEDLRDEDEIRFLDLVSRIAPDAIISTDGDGDRPLMVDERGRFHRGDVLGIIAAEFLGAAFAAVPINTSDALDLWIKQSHQSMALEKTRIGSPHVIAAMQRAIADGATNVVGWEPNGGFLTGTDFAIYDQTLSALPTRDAMLPILATLLTAIQRNVPVSALFDALPQRATYSGLLDDFPKSMSGRIVKRFSPEDATIVEAIFEGSNTSLKLAHEDDAATRSTRHLTDELLALRQEIGIVFSAICNLGKVVRLNYVDGIRIWFENGDIVHIRPSGNAPQLRVYAVSNDPELAKDIVQRVLESAAGWADQNNA